MNRKTFSFICTAIRAAITETKLNAEDRALFSKALLPEYYALAKKHDVAHLVAHAIIENDLLGEKSRALDNTVMTAVLRCEQLGYELTQLCAFFEEEGIDFLPLKGSVLRDRYPESWMRTSCDIDILVKEADLDRARDRLVEKRGYRYEAKGEHDISLFLNERIHLELHYALIGDGIAKKSSEVLKNIWRYTNIKSGKAHWHELSDEAFYFYHVAHAAKHFEQGGCGIRPLIDLYILDKMENTDVEKRNALLCEGGLEKFTAVIRKLSRVWFQGEDHDAISQKAEQYILNGGVYGNIENAIAIQQQKKGGRFRYALSKIFLPYNVIKFHYPILEKHRWLTPLMQIRRWFKLVFCGHAKRSLRHLKLNQNLSNEEAIATQQFLDELGL